MIDMPTLSLGYVDHEEDMVRAYSASDGFVLPTRAETFGLVVLEGLACGTPVVSFNVGGVSDMVRPGVTGYLAEPENSEDLAVGIRQVLDNDTLRHEMSRQCRDIAENEYSLEQHVQKHEELYRTILHQNKHKSKVA